MAYIEGVTISGTEKERMACDNRRMTIKTAVNLDDLFLTRDDNGETEIKSVFAPSAYQLRALARWAAETADDMEGRA